jgi:hypothetical protein
LIIPIDLKPLKATMRSTTSTILDQIGAEKTKVGERLARLDTERATVAARLTDLETAERVLTRVGKTQPVADAHRLPPQMQGSPLRAEAAGGRQEQSRANQRDANPARRALASASWPWLPAGPDRSFTWRAPRIAQIMSASQCSAIFAPDGCRSEMASCM